MSFILYFVYVIIALWIYRLLSYYFDNSSERSTYKTKKYRNQ